MKQNEIEWKQPPRYTKKILTPITASRVDVLRFDSEPKFLSSDQLTRDEIFNVLICNGSKEEIKNLLEK